MSDEDLSGLRRLAFIASWGEPSLGGFTGTLKYSGEMVFSPKFRRSFRVDSCLVFRHFQKELQERKERFSED
jgi:hypothetical protein